MNEITLWVSRTFPRKAWFTVTPESVTYHEEHEYAFTGEPEVRSPASREVHDYDAMHHTCIWGALLPVALADATPEQREEAEYMLRSQAERASDRSRQLAATAEYLYSVCGK
jgi:hypothetical protein